MNNKIPDKFKVTIEPKTYSGEAPIHGATLDCSRCDRVYAFPKPSEGPIRCECGWWYRNENGLIMEEFRPRLGI